MKPLAAAAGKPSLRSRVLRHVMVPLALTWLVGTLVMLVVARAFMHEAFDRTLLDNAYVVAANVRKADGGSLELSLSPHEISSVTFDQFETVYFAVLTRDGELVAGQPGLHVASPPPEETAGNFPYLFSDFPLNGVAVRAVTLQQQTPSPFVVVVAETTQNRTHQLQMLLVWSIVPQLAFLLVLPWWLRRAIARDMQPLVELQDAMNTRDAKDLTPVTVNASTRDIERLGSALNCSGASRRAAAPSASSPATWPMRCARRWPASVRWPTMACGRRTPRSGAPSCRALPRVRRGPAGSSTSSWLWRSPKKHALTSNWCPWRWTTWCRTA